MTVLFDRLAAGATALLLLIALGCGTDADDVDLAPFENFSKDSDEAFFDPPPDDNKFDTTAGIKGPVVQADESNTQVWAVPNRWEDTDTDAARAAGIAWEADSGLDWNEKYAAWVRGLKKIDADGFGTTFELSTPFEGVALRSPTLECAEATVFLRVAFASWYGLPFYMTAWAEGSNLHIGHFGVWRDNAPDGRFPSFKTRYEDHSDQAGSVTPETWPSDAKLARRKLTLSRDDANEWLGDEAYAGAYFDKIFLNKRVGHFLVYVLTYTGSIHLASTQNTFNLKPEAVREGDTLLHRWQRKGIGHTMVVKRVDPIEGTDFIEAELMSGSMPRRQPKWENAASSKFNFTKSYGGGVGTDSDDNEYATLGGGIKRWRVAKTSGGRWHNEVAVNDQAVFIPRNDVDAIRARPAQFEELLKEETPELKRDTLLERIQSYRDHLKNFPASCSARIHREEFFTELYDLQEREFGKNQTETDAEFRILDDYVFAQLQYDKSRTCCWNSSTSAMYELIMAFNTAWVHDDEAGQCREPVVFKMVDDGYSVFQEYAEEQGQAADWVAWSADEGCPQASTVTTATEAEHVHESYCTSFPGGIPSE